MYCKNCHNILKDDELICPNCGYDNTALDNTLEETKEIMLDQKLVNKPIKNTLTIKVIIILLLLVTLFVIAIYIIKDSKSIDNENNEPSTKEITNILDKEFKFKDLKMNYPSNDFGTSKNTIFYKNNNAFNIEVSSLEENEYNDIINSNELLESKLGNINTLTYAEENSYYHVFNYNNNYYLITVNYIITETVEGTSIQLEIAKILNTLN